mmetsp:Transcript_102998/g.332312  ORF Transcript_102998/g.332312 Transcript_102998/m.332312 type:complete len:85 (+) Transcript_102998:248-502(+)
MGHEAAPEAALRRFSYIDSSSEIFVDALCFTDLVLPLNVTSTSTVVSTPASGRATLGIAALRAGGKGAAAGGAGAAGTGELHKA